MRTKKHILGGCLALAALLHAAGTDAQSPAKDAISDGVVKIGLILDMSGPYAELTGKGSEAAARMAVEDFGGKVLGAPIQVVVADHHDNADQAATIARDWFEKQHVDAIMDVSGSSEALIVQRVADTRDKIVILNAPGANRLSQEGCTATSVHYTNDTYAVAHTLGKAIVAKGGTSWFFVTVDYSYGYDLEDETAAVVKANGGTVIGHARHPLGADDLSSYLLQAQQSGAKVVGLADGGDDITNAVKKAAELNMIPGQQIFVGLSMRINQVHDLGPATTQGMMLAESFYWDESDAARAWSKRFFDRVGAMPNALQAGAYSSTLHYLQAMAKAGTDATGPVMDAMRAAPINDFFAQNGVIRADGLMVHDMYLYQVKTPAESHGAWDYLKRVATVPGSEAFEPLADSQCPLVKK
ncbi:MAG TPA: ABC transporter substrate-binding protein [Stellaceae bacterium]|jgi:branched-chain amino acid transport system substrate-binding protein|nr:ABC transporter substrate-binding protein [Stellaceae bacterium]